jgi:hypothetical protein
MPRESGRMVGIEKVDKWILSDFINDKFSIYIIFRHIFLNMMNL